MARRKSRQDKRSAQILHALRRARERLSGFWDERDIFMLTHRIRWGERPEWNQYEHDAVKLGEQSLRVHIYAVHYRGIWIPVAYDRDRKMLASILPLENLEFSGDRPVAYKNSMGMEVRRDRKGSHVRTLADVMNERVS